MNDDTQQARQEAAAKAMDDMLLAFTEPKAVILRADVEHARDQYRAGAWKA